jgi:hypothetical protein
MFFAYTDDSRFKHNGVQWQLMATVLIKDSEFESLESIMSVVAANAIPFEKQPLFVEFKASEIYNGFGLYQGVDELQRFTAIETLLSLLSHSDIGVIYGAVNLNELKKGNFASVEPLDIGFRICLRGAENWVWYQLKQQFERHTGNKYVRFDSTALFIVDERSKETRATLQQTYREMRRPSDPKERQLTHLFDDMYFGDSKFSVGIQLADACAYFIGKHVSGDMGAEEFYAMIEPHIVHFEIEPKGLLG